ncbi:chemotaxis protein CheX [Paucisalibacillus globulus]|uniref:chemotaxis protein CheX n=1 Tax=Paucisalibacillus globulus TaxID=351095 RepID=UPI0003FA81C0|nr:chemotaxis protein CheX [Paucisalibacillus globulus]
MKKTENSKAITYLLNGTITSIKNIVPLEQKLSKPELLVDKLTLPFGVLIGITGDVKGQLILSGDSNVFSSIAEVMFGMPLEGEMLTSFSGELGNMIGGGLATSIAESGINIDITPPTIMSGQTTLSGYTKTISFQVVFPASRNLSIYFLLN